MKTVTFDQAQAEFEHVFQLAVAGETIVIQRNGKQVGLRSPWHSDEPDIAPRNSSQTTIPAMTSTN